MAFNPDKCMKIVAVNQDGSPFTVELKRYRLLSYTPVYFSTTGEDGSWVGERIDTTSDKTIYVKGTGLTATSSMSYSKFDVSAPYKVEGNITSLLNDGAGGDVPITDDYCFCGLFYNANNITEISPDFFPSTTLAPYCYSEMFWGDGNLKTPNPIVLPAENLSQGCYDSMFSSCEQVDKISVDFKVWSDEATKSWLVLAADAGTFYCPSELP